jgi:ABC-type multidrug transport system fused ATPase/permease subunit
LHPEETEEQAKAKKPFKIAANGGGGIEFKNLWVKYRPELPYVLKGLSCQIKPGEKIGIVGRTGAGKSTFFQTLLRTLELEKGKIKIDGVNIKDVTLEDLRQNMTIVPQDPVLFEGNLRENLDLFENVDDNTLWKCLDKVGLGNKFEKIDGLKSHIANLGSNLSSGER